MRVYQVAREFSPIAGAGGLKEVVNGIAIGLAQLNIESSVFIPCYDFINKQIAKKITHFNITIKKNIYEITTYCHLYKGVHVYLLDFPGLKNKGGIYTYTKKDQEKDSLNVSGQGFRDSDDINILFQISVLKYIATNLISPDILSLHDGHTGLIPGIINGDKSYKAFFRNTKLYFTIHNAGAAYHQTLPVVKLKEYGILHKKVFKKAMFEEYLDPVFLASLYSNVLTVSPYYADELKEFKHDKLSSNLGQFFKKQSIEIIGITNGVDIERFSSFGINKIPNLSEKRTYLKKVKDLLLESSINAYGDLEIDLETPIFLFQNRITEQKGIDQLILVYKDYIDLGGIGHFIVMGQGESRYEDKLLKLSKGAKSFTYIEGYVESIALNLFILSDFFLLPSLWEPCGITDLEAQLVGSIPIVNSTGGLKKVMDGKTGFISNSHKEFVKALIKADNLFTCNKSDLELIKKKAYSNAKNSYNWFDIVKSKYIPMFKELPSGV